MDSSRFNLLFCLLLVATKVNGFAISRPIRLPKKTTNFPLSRLISQPQASKLIIQTKKDHDDDFEIRKDETGAMIYPKVSATFGVLSALVWIFISATALFHHPDPKFADCTMRHNILTMSQAFAFPLPVGWAAVSASLSSDPTISRPMNLSVCLASLWLAGASLFAPKFAFGYDLYSMKLSLVAGLVHVITAVLSLLSRKSSLSTQRSSISTWPVSTYASKLWGMCALGLLWFTLLPIFAPYPLATVPTILGKRLSRPASAFTFLGSACALCLKNGSNRGRGESKDAYKLRKGLLIGSTLHLTLLALKLIGVDGGGFLLPGRGLWEVYPAMLAVPFATASSIAVHALVCFASTR